jgi:acyl-CoA dehydrogenase
MDFAFSPRVQDLQAQVQRFMDDLVLPSNRDWQRYADAGYYPSDVVEPLKAQARAAGLWNLFLPDLRDDEPGTRLSNLDYAPLAEIMGRVPWASEVFNCSAPDTGNIELLHLAATPEQARQWMAPLLEGASARALRCRSPTWPRPTPPTCTRIQRDGDDYVINGRKWFITGALHPACRLAIVMGVSNDAMRRPAHQRHSMILVPDGCAGRGDRAQHAGDGHLARRPLRDGVQKRARAGRPTCWATEGGGFALAQARLGPGRVHHCMRTIGQCELALELMCERALERMAFGGTCRTLPTCRTGSATAGWRSTRRACWCCVRPG